MEADQQGGPNNAPADGPLSPNGAVYMSDGYANAPVHKYASGGGKLITREESGAVPSEFNLMHNISCDAVLFVAAEVTGADDTAI